MKIFNIHLKPAKILSTITIVIAIIFVILAIVGISKQILAKDHIEITNTKYTNILVDADENKDNYIGKKNNINCLFIKTLTPFHSLYCRQNQFSE